MTLMLANGDPCGGTFDGFFQSFANLRHRSPPLKGRSPTHHRGRDMEAFGVVGPSDDFKLSRDSI